MTKFRSLFSFVPFRGLTLLSLVLMLPPGLLRAEPCPPGNNAHHSAAHGIHNLQMFWDTTGQLRLNEIASLQMVSAFEQAPEQIVAGATKDVLWLRFCLPAKLDQDAKTAPRWLRLAPPSLDQISLFLPQESGYAEHQSGDHLPFTTREWPYRLFALPIPSATNTTQPAFLRIETTGSLNLHLELWEEPTFQKLITRDYLLYGIYIGTILLLAVFSLVSWFWLRDTLYLIYAINAFAGAVLLLINTGFGSQYLYPELAGMNDKVVQWLTGPVLAVHVLFFTYLFAIRRNLPWAYPILLGLAGFYLLTAPLSLMAGWREVATAIRLTGIPVGLLGIPLILYLGWKDKERRGYVLAFVPWVLAGFFTGLHHLGWHTGGWLINYSVELGSFIHLVMLPLLLARRTWRAEMEKEQAQTRELQEAHRVEQELEARVALRTEELAQTNRTLEQEMHERIALQGQLQNALATERATLSTQRQFVAMLSHECRTPLAIIDTVAQRLEPVLTQRQPELMPRVGKIRRAVARMLNLLENCLAEDRLAAPGMVLRKELLDTREFLINCYGSKHASDPQRIHLQLPEHPLWITCDRHLFEVALSNLVENALKYSSRDCPVTLRLLFDEQQDLIKIEVTDQGPGIPLEEQERIFDKFSRGDSAPHISGAGLGLHLARELARKQGGEIALTASELGQGSTFTLSLPAAAPGG